MEVLKTGTRDDKEIISCKDLNLKKVMLADLVVENISPILNKEYIKRDKELKQQKKKLKEQREYLQTKKKELEELSKERDRVYKIRKLLDRLEKLVENQTILRNQLLKKETIILLKVLDNLNDDLLEYHLNAAFKLISKKSSIK